MQVAASYAEWDALRDLSAAVRNDGTLLRHDAEMPGFTYWEAFAANGTFATKAAATVVTDAVAPWAQGQETVRVLDVGCGSATFGLLLAQRVPQARIVALDWPDVLVHTRARVERMGLTDRVRFLDGDVFTVPLDGPYEVVVVANLLAQLSPSRARTLLRRLAAVTAPGGRIVFAGFTVGDEPPAASAGAHLLSLLMLAWTRSGEVGSTARYQTLIAESGFSVGKVYQVPGLPVRVIVAERENG